MISALNRLVALVEEHFAGEFDVNGLARALGPDRAEGSELTYLHGVAISGDTAPPAGLDTIDVPAGWWAVFHTTGPYPQALQKAWAATATEWFPSNPWRLRPGPEILAALERANDCSTATSELWLPVEPA